MTRTKKQNRGAAYVLSVKVFCKNLNREVELPLVGDDLKATFEASASECELCGSHGEVDLLVLCECGHQHTIVVHDW